MDPDLGPVEAFATDLRTLKKKAGNPSYRVLAQRTHYSHTVLSDAARGDRLPTLAVTEAFAQACGGDPAEWRAKWQIYHQRTIFEDRFGEIASPQRGDVAEPDNSDHDVEPAERTIATDRTMRTRTALGLIILAVVTSSALTAAGFLYLGHVGAKPAAGPSSGAVSSSRPPGQTDPVADGSDPTRAGCSSDGVTQASTRVHFPTAQLSGEVELRYSPHCHAAWARFAPADGWNPGPGTMVTVWTIRPADQATQSYTVEFGGEAVFGNLLMTARGCVGAEVTIARGGVTSPVAATACMVIN